MITYLYTLILYRPLLNLLVIFYNYIPGHDIGLAIILVTFVIRLALAPLSSSALKSQKSMQNIQPKLDELKEKYKNDKEKMGQEMMKLYKEEKVNPFSSCLPILIQLPIFIAVYRVFRSGLMSTFSTDLYSFVKNPGVINPVTLHILNLSNPNIILAILAGAAQFWQTRMLLVQRPPKGMRNDGGKDEDTMAIVNKQMTYMMPIFTIFLGIKLPGGLALYWLVTTLLSVAQQYWILRRNPKPKAPTAPSAPVIAPPSAPIAGK